MTLGTPSRASHFFTNLRASPTPVNDITWYNGHQPLERVLANTRLLLVHLRGRGVWLTNQLLEAVERPWEVHAVAQEL